MNIFNQSFHLSNPELFRNKKTAPVKWGGSKILREDFNKG